MSDLPPVPSDPTRAAISLFWDARAVQAETQTNAGVQGAAARAGTHMNSVRDLVANIFLTEMPDAEVRSGRAVLPGYYRASKNWDLVVTYKDHLVAAVEFKSQVGAVGQNANNRSEEALGNAVDIWAAQSKNEAFGMIPPWLAYIFILEETSDTERPIGRFRPMFPTDPAFDGSSYNQAYQITIARFVADNVYQAGWYITTRILDDETATYDEPLATATGRSFRAAVRGRVDFVRSVLG